MKNYLITIKINIPYPKSFTYREKASGIGTAINRAIKQLRKEIAGKKIAEINIKAIIIK